MRLWRTPRTTVALALATGLSLVAGCAADPGGPDGPDRSAPPTSQATATTYEQYDGLFAEWQDAFIECARSEGLPASAPVDGRGIDNGSSPDRPVAEGVGLDRECIERVGLPPRAPSLTPETLSGLYDLSLEQAECLRRAGYPVTPAPSREVWIETYTSDEPAWLPMQAVYDSGGDAAAAVAACPDPDPRDVAP